MEKLYDCKRKSGSFIDIKYNLKDIINSDYMNLENYKIFDFIGTTDMQNLTKKQAKEKFDLFMAHKDERIEELKKLTSCGLTLEHDVTFRYEQGMVPDIKKSNVIKKGIELDFSEESLQALNEWLIREVKKVSGDFSDNADYYYSLEGHVSWVPSLWKSIAIDCGIYLSEMLINKCPSLEWYLDEKATKKSDDRFYPSIHCFPKAHPNYYTSYVWQIYRYIYAELLSRQERQPKDFAHYYSSSMELI